jgi:hypothetical protein
MARTTIIIEEDAQQQIHILLEKGAANGTRNDQKVAAQLVGIAKGMLNPQTNQKLRALQSNPMIGNLLKQFGL